MISKDTYHVRRAHASTPPEWRYTDNDSWSTNELDIDCQGVTLYNLYLARWWAAGAPAARATLDRR